MLKTNAGLFQQDKITLIEQIVLTITISGALRLTSHEYFVEIDRDITNDSRGNRNARKVQAIIKVSLWGAVKG